jgi:hypothetical protein
MVSSTTQTSGKASLTEQEKLQHAEFSKALHGSSVEKSAGLRAMFGKGSDAKKLAVDEYFKHWDNKAAKDETVADRAVSFAITANPSYTDTRMFSEPDGRVPESCQTVLQHRHRPLRACVVRLLPLLPLLVRRELRNRHGPP